MGSHQFTTLGMTRLVSALLALTLSASALAEDDVAVLVPPGVSTTSWEALSPLDVHPRTSLTIVEQLRHNHYLRKPLDDDASSAVFDKYLSTLDPSRSYFMADDLAELESYRYTLDDALKRGDLSPAFDMFNRFQARQIDRLEYLLSLLESPEGEAGGVHALDFTIDESIEIDRENAPWMRDRAALDDLWRKRLKANVLSMVLNGKELDEIGEVLVKRFSNRLKQARQTKSEDAFQLYVNAFASTYDPHTQYFSPRTSENFNINMSLSLEGIGAVLGNEDDYTTVVRLVPAGPADKAGTLKPGDRIVSVGQGEQGPLIDVVGWRLDDVVELIRGPKDSVVRLEIRATEANADADRVIAITRNKVQLEEQSAQKKLLTLNHQGREHRIGVIEIPTFYVDFNALRQGDPDFKSTTRDVRRLIDELKAEGVDGLVIDLRDNGGGSLQEADSLTGLFIKSGPTVQVKSARRRANVYADTDDSVAWDGPLAVVVNRLSASASEIFAGAIQDYERGLIIGSQTFGKGTVQTLIPLNRGQLKITAAKFYRVSGQSTQHQGIIPDIAFPEVYDSERIGESSLDDAMPWDVIKPAIYPHGDEIQPVLAGLRTKHSQRAATDPDFRYMRALSDRSRELAARTHLSLNEANRRAEKDADDAWRLALENELRAAKGEPQLASLDDLLDDGEPEAAEADDSSETEVELADTDEAAATTDDEAKQETLSANDDPLLREAGNVLLDFIGMTRQVAVVENLANDRATIVQ